MTVSRSHHNVSNRHIILETITANIREALSMSFQFVDNAFIDRGTRKLIRSHAAKGKNLGKGRPRRKPRATAVQLHTSARIATTRESESDDRMDDQGFILNHAFGDEFSFLAIPFELSPRSKAIFRQGLAPTRNCSRVVYSSSNSVLSPRNRVMSGFAKKRD